MFSPTRQPPFALLLALAWAVIAAQLLFQHWGHTAQTLNDTDDAMRLVEMRDFLAGQGWFDLHQGGVQPPIGLDSHWSRLIDAGLAGLFVLFHTVVDATLAERLMRAFWPILWLSGLSPPWFIYGGAAVCGATIAMVRLVPRAHVGVYGMIALVANLVMLVMFARLVGPFTAAPGLAVIMAMTFANHRRVAPAPLLAVMICLAVLLPWVAEQVGVAAVSTSVSGNALVFHTAATELAPSWATAGLVAYVLLLIGMAVGLTRAAANDRRAVQRTVQVQAWQLRQLVTR